MNTTTTTTKTKTKTKPTTWTKTKKTAKKATKKTTKTSTGVKFTAKEWGFLESILSMTYAVATKGGVQFINLKTPGTSNDPIVILVGRKSQVYAE